MTQSLPGAVLFACNLNQVRSPMAAALMRQAFGDRVFVDSCGIVPRGEVDPFVAAVLSEIGWDIGQHDAQAFDDLEDGSFDMIGLLSRRRRWSVREAMAKGRATGGGILAHRRSHPAAGGSREQTLEAYRAVREALRRRILARFGSPSTMTG